MNRRSFLATSTALAVAACAGKTQTQLQSDVELIAAGLSGVVAALQGLPSGMKPGADIITQAEAAIADIKANAAEIATSLTPQASTVQAIANAVSTLSTLLAPFFPVAPAIAAVVQAAVALVPVILSAVGATAPASAQRVSVTPGQARLTLRAAASK